MFDWINIWEEKVEGDDDREITGIRVDCNGVHLEVFDNSDESVRIYSLELPTLKIIGTHIMIGIDKFYMDYELED